MIKYLLKVTNEYRLETEQDANDFHKELETFCHDNEYVLVSWSQTYKSRKAGGELVDEFYVCKACIQFNDVKEPEIALNNIQYNMISHFGE